MNTFLRKFNELHVRSFILNFSSDTTIDKLKDLKEGRRIVFICVILFVVTVLLNYIFIFIVLVTIIKYINFEYIILTLSRLLVKIRH